MELHMVNRNRQKEHFELISLNFCKIPFQITIQS